MPASAQESAPIGPKILYGYDPPFGIARNFASGHWIKIDFSRISGQIPKMRLNAVLTKVGMKDEEIIVFWGESGWNRPKTGKNGEIEAFAGRGFCLRQKKNKKFVCGVTRPPLRASIYPHPHPKR